MAAAIPRPRYTQVPDVLFDELLPDLSGSELKVLLYVVRRTLGFGKQADAISLSQICRGITRRSGAAVDRGTGLSRHSAIVAIRSLVARGLITTVHQAGDRGHESTVFSLRFVADAAGSGAAMDLPGAVVAPGGSAEIALGVVQRRNQGWCSDGTTPSAISAPGGSAEIALTRDSDKKQINKQIQETATTDRSGGSLPPSSLETRWRDAFGRQPNAAQQAMLSRYQDVEIAAGLPGLLAACITYTGELGKGTGYLRATFEGCLRERHFPGERLTPVAHSQGNAPGGVGRAAAARRPTGGSGASSPPDHAAAVAANRRQMAIAGIDMDRLDALFFGPNPPADELDVYRNPAAYGVAIDPAKQRALIAGVAVPAAS